ncbi:MULTISPECIES: type VI secretion system-associated protein TagO [Klebsiella]|uniref:type VI secretion system-associated protein TagO n=1 Tax=Klebsiella TaxID=570 RepID=UPI0027BB425E|nr:type VI secretion system-associated protein TagO [Klebsiella michiganensis]MDQ2565552.1 type VI secretion system-associated protein TagO [Klebsiella michiganensis]
MKMKTRYLLLIIISAIFAGNSFAEDIEMISGWGISKQKDLMTDNLNVIVGLQSEPYNEAGSMAAIAVRCFNNKTELLIHADGYYRRPTSTVMMRFDSEKATSAPWSVSEGGKALFSRSPIDTAKKITEHNSLIIRFQPYGKGHIDAKFNLDGADLAIDEVRKACSWP